MLRLMFSSAALAASPSLQETAMRPDPIAAPTTDASPAAAASAAAGGRRTLSTAFVRIGPDGHLTVELHDGRVLVLRDVVMRRSDYCGVQVRGGAPAGTFCGGYADVAAARPGGAPAASPPPDTAVGPTPISG